MNKGRLIGGIACLVLAVVLGVLWLVLPPDEFVFLSWEDDTWDWLPAAIFGVVGIVLVATAGIGRQKAATQPSRPQPVIDPEKAALNNRLETIGWGCFLVMFGGFLLVPNTVVAKGIWSIGVGAIMLGLNAARYFYKIRMSGFTTVLGIISVIGGILQLLGWEEIGGAFLLIVLGAFLLLKPWFDKRQLFGRAEEA
jgi:hypothetical protein